MEKNDNLTAKAQAYAQEVLKEQLDAVANAYIKGYNDAMADQLHEPVSELYDKFVDLGLDSGMMWTTTPSSSTSNQWREVGYHEALKYGIPTQEQFEEMLGRCVLRNNDTFRAPSSEEIRFYFHGAEDRCTWVKSDVEDDKAVAFYLYEDGSYEFKRTFVGMRLRIMRVKNKND